MRIRNKRFCYKSVDFYRFEFAVFANINLSITMTVIGRHQQMITTSIPFAGNA